MLVAGTRPYEWAAANGLSKSFVTAIKRGGADYKPRRKWLEKLIAASGKSRDWWLTGTDAEAPASPASAAPRVEERRAGYHAINLDTLTLVIGAVDLLLPGYSPRDRANLIALAYDYMAAKRSSDRELLAAFLRQWAKSALAQPPVPDFHSPEVMGSSKKE